MAWRAGKYLNPVLDALKDLGGSARPAEVYDWVAGHCGVSEQERSKKHAGGGSRFENDVAWARFGLVRSGYVDSSKRGVWSVTEQGRTAGTFTEEEIDDILKKCTVPNPCEKKEPEKSPDDPGGYRERALEIMQALPP